VRYGMRIGWASLLGVLILSFFYESTPMNDFVFCWFRRLTDLPCLGCGLTRSFVAVSHGDLLSAFGHHLAGPLLYFAAWLSVIRPAAAWTIKKPIPSFSVQIPRTFRAFWWAVLFMFLLNGVLTFVEILW